VHLATELLAMQAGLSLQHIPYRGTAGALTDLVAGRTEFMITAIASSSGQLRGGLLRVLAYTEPGRPAGTPEAPTVREATGVDYATGIWWGLYAPAGLPEPVRATLHAAVNAILAEPDFARYLAREGAVPAPVTPAAFAALLAEEMAAMRNLVATARVTAE
jgi:tripartite-type tricarboxylate transporter receptor subunit TctC